jgi:hydrogenase nickel incorporation protein HypB
VKQITTATVCHLEAEMVAAALDGWLLDAPDFLFSVTEGEGKPPKCPAIFNTSDLAIITKTDLSDAVSFDAVEAYRSIRSVRPGMEIFEVSARSGAGMEPLLGSLLARRDAARLGRSSP